MRETGSASAPRDAGAIRLAPREAEILALLCEGKQVKVIAHDLSLSPETVRYYVKRIYRALGVHNRALAVAKALATPSLMRRKAKELPAAPAELKPLEFVGRAQELRALLDALEANRLVTATGIGGNGKTTLARAAFERIREERDAAWVPLKSAASNDLVHRIAHVVNVDLRQSGDAAWIELGDMLAASETCLVLDNFEHLIDQGNGLSKLLERAPRISVLTTSRLPIGLADEHVFPVQGLSLIDAGNAGRSKAADLFLNLVTQRQPDIQFDAADHLTIHEICVRLGGTPLAIKLAASWGDVLDPTQILRSLKNRGDLLAGPTESTRQDGVREILKATIALRSAAERAELQRLAWFSDTFSLEDARIVAGSSARSLAIFVRSALVQPVSLHSDHYAIHPLVAELMIEELHDSDQFAAVAQRHAEYFLNRLVRAGQATASGENMSVDDIKRAWLSACENDRIELLQAAFVPFATWMVWSRRGAEAISHFDTALRTIGKIAEVSERNRLELDLRLAYGAVLMSCKGQAATENGKNFAAALALADRDTQKRQRHQALFGTSRYEMMRELYPDARAHAVECYELAKELPDHGALIEAGALLGGIDVFCGRIADARAPLLQAAKAYSLSESLPLRSRFGQDIGVLANAYLSWAEWQLGDEARALRTLRKAKQIADDLDDPIAMAWYCTYASALHLLRLEFAQSLAISELGHAIAKDFDLTLLRVSLAGQIGWSRAMVGDIHQGREYFHQTLRERKRLGMRSADNWVALGVAMVDHRAGNHDIALDTIEDRVELSAATGSTWMISELYRIKGDILSDKGQQEYALSAYRAALDQSDRDKTFAFSARILLAIAEFSRTTGQFDPVKAEIADRLTGDLARVDTQEADRLRAFLT